MLAIARVNESGEIFWCSHNWPYVTGFSFLKTIGSKASDLIPSYQMNVVEQRLTIQNRAMFAHTFQLDDSIVLIIEERTLSTKQIHQSALLIDELPSPRMQEVIRQVNKLAFTDATILVLGESGVGKEGIARLIHQSSSRASGPYIKLNCGAIPETLVESELFGYAPGAFTGAERGGKKGVFEEADGGTLFLDEVGELPIASQAKLLHVLQERTFKKIGEVKTLSANVRIIAATNRNLEEDVQAGKFRKDLYFRLCVLPIEIAPLRERKEDIEPLVHHFLHKFKLKYGIDRSVSQAVVQAFQVYGWPGNVRQLEHVIERMVLLSENQELGFFDLPPFLRSDENSNPKDFSGLTVLENEKPIHIQKIIPLKEATTFVEKELLRMARTISTSTYEIADMLGVDQSTVSRKLKQYLS
ncbi:sigma-54 interaction domain-containing protein [Brevibacillus sp. SYSU BS000544]|uniref:sigma-54 interaction domain-containing protein n=1 Tax=Brevibacillus sp. SYSU BS000544 TaxID=3416443 RepID=UPI003CE460DD